MSIKFNGDEYKVDFERCPKYARTKQKILMSTLTHGSDSISIIF